MIKVGHWNNHFNLNDIHDKLFIGSTSSEHHQLELQKSKGIVATGTWWHARDVARNTNFGWPDNSIQLFCLAVSGSVIDRSRPHDFHQVHCITGGSRAMYHSLRFKVQLNSYTNYWKAKENSTIDFLYDRNYLYKFKGHLLPIWCAESVVIPLLRIRIVAI